MRYLNGDIFESQCDALVNAVNCRGVMGAGIAKSFRFRFPEMYRDYQKFCERDELIIGKIHTWKNPAKKPPWIVNFPTMDYPGEKTTKKVITNGFLALRGFVEETSIQSIALPALGCGIGRFSWDQFKLLVEEFSRLVPHVYLEIYQPH